MKKTISVVSPFALDSFRDTKIAGDMVAYLISESEKVALLYAPENTATPWIVAVYPVEENGKTTWAWGHYFHNEGAGRADYSKTVKAHR